MRVDPADIGYFVDPGVVGFILRDRDVFARSAGDFSKVAGTVAEITGGAGISATVIVDDWILVGYFPRETFLQFGA
ncbi:MAG: hypothetical protein KDJ80_07670 [Nitratireductor sp.]|nr:hypothetical protein [Nitratireductor sp.]